MRDVFTNKNCKRVDVCHYRCMILHGERTRCDQNYGVLAMLNKGFMRFWDSRSSDVEKGCGVGIRDQLRSTCGVQSVLYFRSWSHERRIALQSVMQAGKPKLTLRFSLHGSNLQNVASSTFSGYALPPMPREDMRSSKHSMRKLNKTVQLSSFPFGCDGSYSLARRCL